MVLMCLFVCLFVCLSHPIYFIMMDVLLGQYTLDPQYVYRFRNPIKWLWLRAGPSENKIFPLFVGKRNNKKIQEILKIFFVFRGFVQIKDFFVKFLLVFVGQ